MCGGQPNDCNLLIKRNGVNSHRLINNQEKQNERSSLSHWKTCKHGKSKKTFYLVFSGYACTELVEVPGDGKGI